MIKFPSKQTDATVPHPTLALPYLLIEHKNKKDGIREKLKKKIALKQPVILSNSS